MTETPEVALVSQTLSGVLALNVNQMLGVMATKLDARNATVMTLAQLIYNVTW